MSTLLYEICITTAYRFEVISLTSSLRPCNIDNNKQRKFISPQEIDDENLQLICDKSYHLDSFDDNSYIPIKDVGPSLHIAELFHGPTFCFKDFG